MNAVYWIIPQLLAGRPGPMTVRWDPEQLWSGGIRTIVSLVWVEGTDIRAAGLRHYRAPLMGALVSLPALQNRLARRMVPVVDYIAGEVKADRTTLVHCRAGKDRTGAVLAGYLIRHRGLSSDEAIHLVRQANPRAMTAPGFARLPELFERETYRFND